MIKRQIADQVKILAKQYPVITVIGPRQSGKTTLCRHLFKDYSYFNLEDPDQRDFANNDPKGFLTQHQQGYIIDEIQRVPNLTSYIQVLVDEHKSYGKYILTGSQNFSIQEALSQSLAGRTAILKLLPLSIAETATNVNYSNVQLIYQGFYPRIYDEKLNPSQAYASYVATYVERDLRQLSLVKDIIKFQTFLKLIAGRTGQILNLEKLGADCGVSQPTARNWINLLEASFIVFRLPPYHANVRKRLIKSPKIYFYDVGLATYLLGIESHEQVFSHPLRGELFENMIITEAVKSRYNQGKEANFHFYRDSDGNEIDLLWPVANHNIPIEIKSGETLAADFFKNFKKYRAVSKDKEFQNMLVYGGSKPQARTDCLISTSKSFADDVQQIIAKAK